MKIIFHVFPVLPYGLLRRRFSRVYMGAGSEFFQIPKPIWGKSLEFFQVPVPIYASVRSNISIYFFIFLHIFDIIISTYFPHIPSYIVIFLSYLLHQKIPESDVIREVVGRGVLANPEIIPQVQSWKFF